MDETCTDVNGDTTSRSVSKFSSENTAHEMVKDPHILQNSDSSETTVDGSDIKTNPRNDLTLAEEKEERSRHFTNLDTSESLSLQRCMQQSCCGNMVHCPFCDTGQFKPTQPARVRDHLHRTHFQHAVYYNVIPGLMIVKCFHDCRGPNTKGGHYHCPACSATLLKRNAFAQHLRAHADWEGHEAGAVLAPDSKHPAFIYYQDYKIALCRKKCSDTLEAHYHCPLCYRTSQHLAALTAHLWRCKKQAVMVQKCGDDAEATSTAELFSPELVKSVCHPKDVPNFKWHLSVVRNLSDLPLTRCTQADCCKGRYHCPLCTTAKLKPNHLCHMRQHYVSHWRSGVPFGDYTVLVCYLPCEARHGRDKVRFHYHCPLCGDTRRRREAMTSHLVHCDPSKQDTAHQQDAENDDDASDDCEADYALEYSADGSLVMAAVSSVPGHSVAPSARRNSADQAELQAAESLVDMDRILKQSANRQPILVSQAAPQLTSTVVDSIRATDQQTELPAEELQQEVVLQDGENVKNADIDGHNESVRGSLGSHSCTGKIDENFQQEQVSNAVKGSNTFEVVPGSEMEARQNDGVDDTASARPDAEDEELEVFEQVTTQVSTNIVSQLQQRGELSECLQAVGRVCGVSWQQSGDSVSMTCCWNDLCHVQNCLRQILREGLQSFLKSPLAKPPSKSSPRKSTPPSQTQDSCAAPVTVGKKRGRPRGSKNRKFTDSDEYSPPPKLSRLVSSQKETVSQNNHSQGNALAASDEAKGNHSDSAGGQTGSEVTISGYRGRTRGKKINFAQLNTGGSSPTRESVEETYQIKSSQPNQIKTPEVSVKRGRGRPRKSNAGVTVVVTPSAQTEVQQFGDASVLTHSVQHSEKSEVPVVSVVNTTGSSVTPKDSDGMESSRRGLSDVNVSCDTSPSQSNPKTSEPGNSSMPDLHTGTGTVPVSALSPTKNVTDGDTLDDNSAADMPKQTQTVQSHCTPISAKVHIVSSKLTQTPVHLVEKSQEQGQRLLHQPDTPDLNISEQDSPYPVKAVKSASKKKYSSKSKVEDFAIIPTIVFDYSALDGDNDQGEEVENAPSSSSNQEGIFSTDSQSFVAPKPTSVLKENQGDAESSRKNHTDLHSESDGVPEKPAEELNAAACQENSDTTVSGAVESSATPAVTENADGDTSQNSLTCPLCPLVTETYTHLCGHLTSDHPESPQVTCDLCEIACPTNGALLLHVERRHGPRPLSAVRSSGTHVCPVCSKVYASATALRWHRSFIHKQSSARRRTRHKLYCALCNYQAADPWDMRHHREGHRDRPAACPVCSKVMSTENAVKVHVATVHSNTSFPCPLCSKVFAHVRYLRSHIRRHGGEKRHACGICGWRFHETNTLRAHMDTHKPRSQRTYAFKCMFCPASYNSGANYRDHLNKHTGERPHICAKCGRGFAFRSMLKTHMAFVHSSERPHACSDCSKTFKTRQQLRQHSLSHTGNSPYVCGKCGRAMVSSTRLKAHAKRCQGGNFAGKQVLIQQPPTVTVLTGPDPKLQTIQLLPRDAVSVLQGGDVSTPLFSLLQGRQVSVIQNAQNKQSVLTLLPLQNIVSQDGVQISAQSQEAVNTLSVGDLRNGPSTSGVIGTISLSQSVAELGPTRPEDAVLFSQADSGTAGVSGVLELGTSGENSLEQSADVHYVQTGQSIHLGTPVKEEVAQPSESQTSVSLEATGSGNQVVNISVGDESGETRTLLLSPELMKQEVLIIENEDGQQSLINLADLQVVHSDNTDCAAHPGVSVSDTLSNTGESESYQGVQIVQAASEVGILDSISQGSQPDSMSQESQLSSVEQSQFGASEEESENKTAVFVCSTCDQAFESLTQAEQHILREHCEVGGGSEQTEGKDSVVGHDNLDTSEAVTVDTITMDSLTGN